MKSVMAVLILLSALLYAKPAETPVKRYQALHINPHAPEIDGKADDIIWHKARPESDFVQHNPVEGKAPGEKTTFKIVYDATDLYVLIRAYDSQPQKISRQVTRRDDVDNSDVVEVLLDSYFDRRTAFGFGVSAAGVKYDAIYSGDGESQDESWDPVWDVATSVDDSGWVAEMRIPYSQIRFSKKAEQTWGLEFYRKIYRTQEEDLWQPIPKNGSGLVSYFGLLEGLKNIRMPNRIEILPYTVSKYSTYEKEAGNPFSGGRDYNASFGVDGKVGVTGNLTADFTVNPDFGQVEADPSEVNLSAFETFFEEKRPFFIEGKNIFRFSLAPGDGDMSRETLFYSRRIGRTPHYEPDLADDEYINAPDHTSIISAAKLSGKTASGWSVGMLDAVTRQEKASIDNGIRRQDLVVEPTTNYLVGRMKKDFRQGSSTLGAMFTATNRDIHHNYLNFIPTAAYTGGVDVDHQWDDKTYAAGMNMAFSHVRGHKEAIQDLQTASARYYQRPDANYLKLDSSRTSLSGYGGSFYLGKFSRGRWRYMVGGVWRSPGFELNDLGYLREADQIMQFFWVGYRISNPWAVFNNIGININQWNGWNFGYQKIYVGGNVNFYAQLHNYWGINGGINREGTGLSPSALRGGPSLRYPGGWNTWYGVSTDARRSWQFSLDGSAYRDDDRIGYNHYLRVGLTVKSSRRSSFSLKPFYQYRVSNLQYIDTFEMNGQDRFVFGKLNQKTLGLEFRLNYSLTPALSIQYYGQPFLSSGKFNRFKKITNPTSRQPEKRYSEYEGNEVTYDSADEVYQVDENRDGAADYSFDQPDFNFRQFRSNLVIRWEYHPGSQLYLVWSQGRTSDENLGELSPGRDFRELFRMNPNNVFLIKVNHWFSL